MQLSEKGMNGLGKMTVNEGHPRRVPEGWVGERVIPFGVPLGHSEQAPIPPLLKSFPLQFSSQPKPSNKGRGEVASGQTDSKGQNTSGRWASS